MKGGVENFSLLHFGWIMFTMLLMFVVITNYKRKSLQQKDKLVRRAAILLLVLYIFRVIWALSIGKFSADSMLPFHLCALMVFVDFIAVFWNIKFLKEFGYCAGLPGALIAFLTPDINGFPLFSIQYQVYIYDHFFLILIPLLWVMGDGYRPDKAYGNKVFGSMAVLAIMDGFINKMLHSNYMFVSKAPPHTPFVIIQNNLGYAGYITFLVIGAYVAIKLMYMPWEYK